ncbi:MAG: hypothetical protein WD845_08505 [Pirellulales bacterium]
MTAINDAMRLLDLAQRRAKGVVQLVPRGDVASCANALGTSSVRTIERAQ